MGLSELVHREFENEEDLDGQDDIRYSLLHPITTLIKHHHGRYRQTNVLPTSGSSVSDAVSAAFSTKSKRIASLLRAEPGDSDAGGVRFLQLLVCSQRIFSPFWHCRFLTHALTMKIRLS